MHPFKMRFDDRVFEDILAPYPNFKEKIETITSNFKQDSEHDFLDMDI